MKKTLFSIATIVALGLSFGGCAQKTQIRAIKAAEVNDPSIKDIAVAPFSNDNVSQSVQIDSALSNVTIKGERYFNVSDRVNLEKIMNEKKLNDSGLVDLIHKGSNTGLQQIRTLVTGSIGVDDVAMSNYLEGRTDYNTCVATTTDKKGNTYCTKYREYNVNCQKNTYTLTSNVKFIRVNDSKTIFAKAFTKNSSLSHCEDDSKVLLNKKDANTQQAGHIADELVKLVAPSYVYYTVTLLDDEDIKYTSEQSKQLKMALELIKNERTDKANEVLKSLNNTLGGQSYTTAYDLAVTEEALGNLYAAYELYQKAESLSLAKGKVIEEIAFAMTRAKDSIEQFEKANKQMAGK